jgi:SAM-dependent methyltransferase
MESTHSLITLRYDENLFRFLALPGTDIFTRRRTRIEKNWKKGRRKILDAGFGNGWFSYRAYRSGASVTAVAIQPDLIIKARALYNGFLNIPEDRLQFLQISLYDIDSIRDRFDEIICYETLEHIRNDRDVCQKFHSLLRQDGMLHLCCPNADHPRWQRETLDELEQGGHVRAGYTEESYRQLLEPLGYKIDRIEGVGGRFLVFLQETVQTTARGWFGEAGAAAVAIFAAPFVRFDDAKPHMPFSLYVRAVRTDHRG